MSHTTRLPLSSGFSSFLLLPLARWVRDGIQALGQELRRREAIRVLGEAEDRMLADIGVTRSAIEAAVLRGRRW
ncbi:DUF1127 domain-containing protein [Plastoroseomonas hellenica]|uniref:DUF1127 domain-containing protein n=1 Tax=Plastoroseomonas hellenica TaxID=2687306 RepID=UPI001BA514E8|nr:DUF1127 domain-containing protein [Plastoroseomonas hellenica]MBR0642623.1 DUF1127 domain-containing protein [Plastoroseomonas hellenica]